MAEPERIYESPPSEPEDDLWLAHAAKMLEDSVPTVRNAASELIKAVGILMSVYLAVLGFAKFIPENLKVYKALLIVPIVPWVIAVYFGLLVMKTEMQTINLKSPTDIKEKVAELLEEKQRHLNMAFVLLIVGVVFAFILIVFRPRL